METTNPNRAPLLFFFLLDVFKCPCPIKKWLILNIEGGLESFVQQWDSIYFTIYLMYVSRNSSIIGFQLPLFNIRGKYIFDIFICSVQEIINNSNITKPVFNPQPSAFKQINQLQNTIQFSRNKTISYTHSSTM